METKGKPFGWPRGFHPTELVSLNPFGISVLGPNGQTGDSWHDRQTEDIYKLAAREWENLMTDTAETTTGMLPDVEKYFNAINEASDVYNSARRDSEIGSAGRRTAYDDYHSARVAAWKALETSEVPLLAWIAMNAEDERSNAELLMRDLRPDFTIADMDRIARVHGWCGVWKNEWRRRILDAGVVAAPVYQIQVREPGDEGWRPVRDYGLPIGITKELLDRLFDSGVAFLALDTTNGGNYKFQLDPIQPQPTGRYVDDD